MHAAEPETLPYLFHTFFLQEPGATTRPRAVRSEIRVCYASIAAKVASIDSIDSIHFFFIFKLQAQTDADEH